MDQDIPDIEALPDGTLLTTEEAAPLIGVKPSTLETWRHRSPGRGPAYVRCGSLARYRAADLRSWIEANRVEVRHA